MYAVWHVGTVVKCQQRGSKVVGVKERERGRERGVANDTT